MTYVVQELSYKPHIMAPTIIKLLTVYNETQCDGSNGTRRFLVLASDGYHGTGAYVCRLAQNPKKSLLFQTPCWRIHGNDMGDIFPEDCNVRYQSLRSDYTTVMDISQGVEHVHYALRRFMLKYRHFKKTGDVEDEPMFQSFICMSRMYAVFDNIACALDNIHDIPLLKRIVRTHAHEEIPKTIETLAKLMKRVASANIIKRQWRHSVTNPSYAICRKILFDDLYACNAILSDV